VLAVLTYKHNDVANLDRSPQAATRSCHGKLFIVCEGVPHPAAPIAATPPQSPRSTL
jgi:hypothetical protein